MLVRTGFYFLFILFYFYYLLVFVLGYFLGLIFVVGLIFFFIAVKNINNIIKGGKVQFY